MNPFRIGAVLLVAMLPGCLGPDRVAGGSEVTNGKTVVGSAVDASGAPVANARVWIRDADFLKSADEVASPEPAPDAVTDARGRFEIRLLEAGTYRTEIRGEDGRAATRLLVASDARSQFPPDTLRATGSLEGTLEIPSPGLRSYAHVLGLERVTQADSLGRFAFRDLPAGVFSIVASTSSPDLGYLKTAPAVVRAGDTTHLGVIKIAEFDREDYGQWPFELTLRLPVPGTPTDTIRDFPLLVRLDSSDFDFSLSTGNDLRFSGPSGRHLAYEIERWDAGAKTAAIWVRLDTLVGGSSIDLAMHWGRPDAPSYSRPAAAFAGFAAAWHLGDAPTGGAAVMRSAAAPGPALSGNLAGTAPGMAGYAAEFKGTHALSGTASQELKPAAALTLSAWFAALSPDSTGAEIAGLGNNYGLRIMANGDLVLFAFDDPTWTAPSAALDKWKRVVAPGTRLFDKKWHLAAAVLDGDTLSLNLDGKRVGATYFPGDLAYVFGKDFRIGTHGNGETRFDFTGSIDEVQVSSIARSALWLGLAYETQKPGSTWLQVR